MTPQAALVELLARVGASQDAAVLLSHQELNHWPEAAVAALKAQRLLTKAKPAASAVLIAYLNVGESGRIFFHTAASRHSSGTM